jgi:diguanylate cyclase (GGDEF)-like protein
MLIGYLALSIVLVAVAVVSFRSLDRLDQNMRALVSTDVPLLDVSGEMISAVIALEEYGLRYGRSGTMEFLILFNEQTKAFDRYIENYRLVGKTKRHSADRILSAYNEYQELFKELFVRSAAADDPAVEELAQRIHVKRVELTSLLGAVAAEAAQSQTDRLRQSAKVRETTSQRIMYYSALFIVMAVVIALLITRNIARPLRQLRQATKRIAAGDFENMPQISNRDELGELGRAFSSMAQRLKKLEALALDASPLTRLPGNISIERTLRQRITADVPFAFCHFDLDNFKAFGDKYGYARGSEVIKATADIIQDIVLRHGSPDDFIGHIGGDDFVVITVPDRFEAICTTVIAEFDAIVPSFYTEEDRDRGCIHGKTRQGLEMDFPLMTISIGVIVAHEHRITDPLELGEIAAELKERAKAHRGSRYEVDCPGGGAA